MCRATSLHDWAISYIQRRTLSIRDYVFLSNLTENAKKWPNKWPCRHCRLHGHDVVNLGITTPLIYAVSFLYKVITEVTRNSRIDHRTRTRHRRHQMMGALLLLLGASHFTIAAVIVRQTLVRFCFKTSPE